MKKSIARRYADASDEKKKDAPLGGEGKLMFHKRYLVKKKPLMKSEADERNEALDQSRLSADEDLANTPPGLEEAGTKKRKQP